MEYLIEYFIDADWLGYKKNYNQIVEASEENETIWCKRNQRMILRKKEKVMEEVREGKQKKWWGEK